MYCACETDVLVSMGVARTRGWRYRYAQAGTARRVFGEHRGMVIDLSEMKGVVLDEDRALVHVLSGTPFEVFNGALNGTGWHKVFTHGACGSVCVAGFAAGWGLWLHLRTFGIQSDKAAAFRVALASGTVVTANERENADLFWALRAAPGGNFGVVLQGQLPHGASAVGVGLVPSPGKASRPRRCWNCCNGITPARRAPNSWAT